MHVLLALTLLLQTWVDRWDLTAWGAAHTVQTANHMMVERFDGGGWSYGHVVDNWYPWFCQVVSIIPGDNAGTPLRIYLAPPDGYGVSCYAASNNSPNAGWTTNTGWYEGQRRMYWPARAENWFVPGRNPASPSAYGTVIKVD